MRYFPVGRLRSGMVTKITLFEAHLDGARFGSVPTRRGDEDDADGDGTTEGADADTGGESGRSRTRVGLFGLALLLAAVAVAVAIKRARSAGSENEAEGDETPGRAEAERRSAGEDDAADERTVGAIE